MSNVADRTLLGILAALMAFGPLSIDMYLPAFASIAADFSVSTARVELSLASFFIGLAAGQLLHGSLSDRFGRRPVVLFGLGMYVVDDCGSDAVARCECRRGLCMARHDSIHRGCVRCGPVSQLHDGSALAMAGVVGGCAVASCVMSYSERKIRSVARLSSSQTGACQLQVRGEHHVERR